MKKFVGTSQHDLENKVSILYIFKISIFLFSYIYFKYQYLFVSCSFGKKKFALASKLEDMVLEIVPRLIDMVNELVRKKICKIIMFCVLL